MTRQPIQYPVQNGARGFTLVELLVAMTVIAILVGVLAYAVGAVFKRTGLFTIQQEMNQIEGSIDKFKTQYGFYPPSFKGIVDPNNNDPNDINDVVATANRLLPFINRIAPNHSEAQINPNLGNNIRYIDQWIAEVGISMDWAQGEDLVFWLSGLNKNKQFPLTGGLDTGFVAYNGQDVNGNIIERDAIFDFKTDRLQFNSTTNRSAGYLQPSGEPVPYLYLDWNNYLPTPVGDAMAADGAYVRPGTTLQNIIDAAGNNSLFQQIYENPTTYQLVTFGLDGLLKTDTGLDPNPNDWSKVGPGGVDNVVNFAGDGPNTLETLLLDTN